MSMRTFCMLFTLLSLYGPAGFFWLHLSWDSSLSLFILMLLVLFILRIKVRSLLHHWGWNLLVKIQICVRIVISARCRSCPLSATTSTWIFESATNATASNYNWILVTDLGLLLLLLVLREAALLIWRAGVGHCMVKRVVCCSCLFS